MDHEDATIRAFVDPRRRERCQEALRKPKRRARFRAELAQWDRRFIVQIPPSQQNVEAILKLLIAKGADSACWVISENSELDGKEMGLKAALEETVGYGMGTLILCVAGKLAYFENEDGRCILQR